MGKPHPIMVGLTRRRQELHLSQEELGRLLHMTGAGLCRRETGGTVPSLVEADRQARALGLRLALVPLEKP
ncbi:helix-turn-helix transcriptional regulator [Planomonospora sp. ID67723]|uniref:helix-turn-helix domain-containing protein n=1 Tax=Planomonospora sp. ID67723 TaxID=2738134 RepID=UPI0018C4048F|nr:helix-turn-helix transcriptional regulator [Planomonospora sp. ID67723]MBG0830543.1 helix-turn-helix transcriptional regulator [Planomonospora sp. ID67723]